MSTTAQRVRPDVCHSVTSSAAGSEHRVAQPIEDESALEDLQIEETSEQMVTKQELTCVSRHQTTPCGHPVPLDPQARTETVMLANEDEGFQELDDRLVASQHTEAAFK